jgi:phage terminase large subunit
VEEAEKVSEDSWEKLIPTIRREGSEIWITFNPDEESDPTYQRFVVNRPPGCVTREFNWPSNPWFSEKLRAEKDYLYRVDPEAAAHVWGGRCRQNSSSQIFRGKYTVEAFSVPTDRVLRAQQGWDGPYYGGDWGFSQDPTVLIKLWVKDYVPGKSRGRLYVEKESWGVHVELDDIGAKWKREIPECADGLIRADSARPETISHVKNRSGLRIEGAEKWQGSVEDGIAFLKSFEQIVIHPQCPRHQEEARTYSYKVDRITKAVLTDVVDANNHCWDSDRYALQPAIRQGSGIGTWSRL